MRRIIITTIVLVLLSVPGLFARGMRTDGQGDGGQRAPILQQQPQQE